MLNIQHFSPSSSFPLRPLIISINQAPTVYVDPVLVGPLALEEQQGLLSFTISLAIYWQVTKLADDCICYLDEFRTSDW